MKELFSTLIAIFFCTNISAQKLNQKAFSDSCSKAITYFQLFLINMPHGKSNFQKSKYLFDSAQKQLLELKEKNEIPVQEDQYNLLIKGISIFQAEEFNEFLSKEKKLKDKIKIKVGETYVYLAKEHGAKYQVLSEILKAKLENFK